MSSARTADYTIQGFIYQFNKTLLEVLSSNGTATITIEGLIEDIEVASAGRIDAIQCKYHEANGQFNFSSVYKPVLQMMANFHSNPASDIRYKLYAYFPNEKPAIRVVTQSELEEALSSKSKSLAKYAAALKGKIDLTKFLSKFSFEFGESLKEITDQVETALVASGFDKGEVPVLIYPNAIHLVSQHSIAHDVAKRRLNKKQLLATLKILKATAISRWTLGLRNAEQILVARRAQLKHNLDKNTRKRVFILGPGIEHFQRDIVPFIQEYLAKYHYKPCHTSTPLFCLDCTDAELDDVCNRLHKKDIRALTGKVGKFEKTALLREPIVKCRRGGVVEREAHLRLIAHERTDEILPDYPCDDIFIAGTNSQPKNAARDTLLEIITVGSFQHLKYVLGITNARR